MIDTNNHTNSYGNWSTPNSLVGSGFDIRSHENGLLAIMYGSLERASHFGWLNAGRTLVDKTYIHILWQAKQLPANGVTHHDIATLLELFVREQLQPIWSDLNHLTTNDKARSEAETIAVNLVKNAANSLFGSSYQEEAASWLLYYLCPQLPIFPITNNLRDAIARQHNLSHPLQNQPQLKHDYVSYHHGCSKLLNELKMTLQYPMPAAHYGTNKEIAIIDHVINNSDWWLRHCFIHQLQAISDIYP